MTMIPCPECKKYISEQASVCPACGFTLTPQIVAAQKVKKQKDQLTAALVGIGIFLFMIVLCSGVFTPRSSSSSSSSLWSSPAPKPAVKSNYVTDQARLYKICGDLEEGKTHNIREALILSARQCVRQGKMSRADYERFTKEKFPE